MSIVVCLCVRFARAFWSGFGYQGGGIVLLAFVGEPSSSLLSLGPMGRVGGSPCWLWGVGIFRTFQLMWSRGPV